MYEVLTATLVTWTALAAAAISPGPNMVAVASRGLGSGRRAALTVALGLGAGAFGWALLTSFGLAALFKTYPVLLQILGCAGGAYLIRMGYKGWRSALTGKGSDISPQNSRGRHGDFLYGLTVTATNPKVMLMWATLSTVITGATTSLPVLLVFAFGSAVVIFVIYGTYGLIFAAGGMRSLYARFQRTGDGVFGTVFGLLGIGMISRALFA